MKTITINLLGGDAQKPSGLPIPSGIDLDPVLILIALVGLVMSFGLPNVLTWGVDHFLNEPADRQIQDQKAQMAKNTSGSQRMLERQKVLEGLENDLKALQGLVGQGGTWAGVLEELRAITPTDLWLTDLKTDGNRIEVNGSALDYKAVAYFYTNFQNSRNFAGPILGAINQTAGDNGRDVVRFSLRATIVTPGLSGE